VQEQLPTPQAPEGTDKDLVNGTLQDTTAIPVSVSSAPDTLEPPKENHMEETADENTQGQNIPPHAEPQTEAVPVGEAETTDTVNEPMEVGSTELLSTNKDSVVTEHVPEESVDSSILPAGTEPSDPEVENVPDSTVEPTAPENEPPVDETNNHIADESKEEDVASVHEGESEAEPLPLPLPPTSDDIDSENEAEGEEEDMLVEEAEGEAEEEDAKEAVPEVCTRGGLCAL